MSEAPLPSPGVRVYRCGRGIFFPLILIAMGVIFLCDQMHWLNAGRAFDFFWPVVVVVFGLEVLRCRPSGSRLFVGLGALAVGVILFLQALGYWNLDIGRFWPVLLIAFGLSLLLRPRRRYGRPERLRRAHRRLGEILAEQEAAGSRAAGAPAAEATEGADGSETYLDAVAVLGGHNRRVTSQKFTGGHLTAFFGGLQVDLTQAEIAGAEAVLEVTAFMGGAELRVPNTWELDIQGQPFLGGFNDETHQMPAAGAKRLVVRGTALLGGINIKN